MLETVETILEQQEHNLRRAAERNSIDLDLSNFPRMPTLPDPGTFLVKRPMTHSEIVSNAPSSFYGKLGNLEYRYPDYKFDLRAGIASNRGTGRCLPLKKWFAERPGLDSLEILALCKQTKTLVISDSPDFLLGCSVGQDGEKPFTSCHYLGAEYSAGPTSYARDSFTIVFCSWENGGITGRQLCYIDPGQGIVVARLYGDFTTEDSAACRAELYRLLCIPEPKKAKGECWDIDCADFTGYLDSSHFVGYRLSPDHTLTFKLVDPTCGKCGCRHEDSRFLCKDCHFPYRCYDCGEGLSDEDVYSDDDGECFCQECFYSRYATCDCCSSLVRRDDAILTLNGYAFCCERCAERRGYSACAECGDLSRTDEMLWSDTARAYCCCDGCLPEAHHTCPVCGEYRAEWEMVEVGSEWYCESCAPEEEEEEEEEEEALTAAAQPSQPSQPSLVSEVAA